MYCTIFIRCTTAATRCHSLPFVVTCFITRHSLSFVVTRCTTRCHSLYHSLSLVNIRCHSLSLVVTGCTTRLSFYKRSIVSIKTYKNLWKWLLYKAYKGDAFLNVRFFKSLKTGVYKTYTSSGQEERTNSNEIQLYFDWDDTNRNQNRVNTFSGTVRICLVLINILKN